jgi:hypothetical protein
MKMFNYVGLAASILIGTLVPLAGAQSQPATSVVTPSQSLGDYARSVRKDKKPSTPKHYDNDNLPVNDKLSVVGNAGASDSKSADAKTGNDDQAANNSGDKSADTKNAKSSADETPEEKQARYDKWKEKISAEKSETDAAAKELDLLQREYRLRAAAFYGDAGDRLRNSAEWDKENTQYQQQIADKQKLVDEAKQKLDELQEEARKAGVPSSVRE